MNLKIFFGLLFLINSSVITGQYKYKLEANIIVTVDADIFINCYDLSVGSKTFFSYCVFDLKVNEIVSYQLFMDKYTFVECIIEFPNEISDIYISGDKLVGEDMCFISEYIRYTPKVNRSLLELESSCPPPLGGFIQLHYLEDPKLINDVSSLCTEDIFSLNVIGDDRKMYFGISYSFDGIVTNSTELLSYKHQNTHLDIDLKNIPNIEEYENLYLHIQYDKDGTSFAEPLVIPIIPCSPQLLSFKPQQTTCSYTDDGSFSMVLDRDIPPEKKLLASLFYEFEPDTKPDVYNFLDQKETKVLTSNGDGTYTYQWPKDTPILPGKYKVRYQTYDTITKLESPKWDSLEGEEKGFNIGNPPVISFDLLEITLENVSCFEGKNGQVQIKATGGDGNFEYQLNTDTWKPFTTGNTHIIEQLPKGNHILKVRDGNKCIAKE